MILGAYLICHHVEETTNLFALDIKFGLTTGEINNLVNAYTADTVDIQMMV